MTACYSELSEDISKDNVTTVVWMGRAASVCQRSVLDGLLKPWPSFVTSKEKMCRVG